MAKEPNENGEEEKDLDTAEGEADTSTDGADEGTGEGEADTGADEGEGAGDGEGEGEDEGAADDDTAFVLPEKFKGKSAEEIARSYVNLEQSIQKKATDLARDMLGRRNVAKPKKGEEDELAKEIAATDFSKMKPAEFAQWLVSTVEKRAQDIARRTYETADNTKAEVQKEINTVTKSWPQLKENEGFRDMALALIENAANKGKILTLKEACAQVGKTLGIKPGAKPVAAAEGEGGKEGETVRKTGVERATGAGGGKKQTDEEAVIAGLMGGGAPGTKLGGLGI